MVARAAAGGGGRVLAVAAGIACSRRDGARQRPRALAAAAAALIAAASAQPQPQQPTQAQPPPAQAQVAATVLRVYFHNERLAATADDCATAHPLRREVPQTEAVATAALRQLFAGPTEAERAAGYRSPFSAATAALLRRVFIEQGTAYVDLHDPRTLLPGATSSCGAAEFNTQIERTLRQFPTVRRVILAIDGDPRRFYGWMGQACDLRNDHCDAAPFGRR